MSGDGFTNDREYASGRNKQIGEMLNTPLQNKLGNRFYFWVIDGLTRSINRINRLSNGITRLIAGLTRLINSWGARPGPRAVN